MVLELKDPASVLLFGMRIDLPAAATASAGHEACYHSNESDKESLEIDEEHSPTSGDRTEVHFTLLENDESPTTPPFEKETHPTTNSSGTTEEEQSETSMSQEKTTLKKPDKLLPCPRCSSMDTKFCYYNNYNVNQPRHFCKNCQRYWTAGGTMRNVAVGAGRRKSKNSTSDYRHLTASEAFQMAQAHDASDGIHYQSTSQPKGTMVNFGPDSPVCDSLASTLSVAEEALNGFHRPEEDINSASPNEEEKGGSKANRSCSEAQESAEENTVTSKQREIQTCNGVPPQILCFPGSHVPYPWDSSLCSPHYPIPFHPATTYWGCPDPRTWGHPWMFMAYSSPGPLTSTPNTPTLGKHSRNEEMLNTTEIEEPAKRRNSENGPLIPKTLRIHDPDEAATSSIWSAQANKDGNSYSLSGDALFTTFQPRGDHWNQMGNTSKVLQANPAAFSRSLTFQESV